MTLCVPPGLARVMAMADRQRRTIFREIRLKYLRDRPSCLVPIRRWVKAHAASSPDSRTRVRRRRPRPRDFPPRIYCPPPLRAHASAWPAGRCPPPIGDSPAAFVAAALTAAAVALIAGGAHPVAAFIADMAGNDDFGSSGVTGPSAGSVVGFASIDGKAWDPDDGDDPDASAWLDPAVRPLRVRLVGLDQTPLGGVPVVVLGSGQAGPVLAGPKMTNADGRVRFPIDLVMEQEHDVLIAARPCRAGRRRPPSRCPSTGRPTSRSRSTAASAPRSRSSTPKGGPRTPSPASGRRPSTTARSRPDRAPSSSHGCSGKPRLAPCGCRPGWSSSAFAAPTTSR